MAVSVPLLAAVSATPGVISGVITLDTSAAVPNPNFIPDAMTIDALDSTGLYTAHANATQGGTGCGAGSQTWCYSLPVESALASSDTLRPIDIGKSVPYVSDRIPFKPSAPVAIGQSQTLTSINMAGSTEFFPFNSVSTRPPTTPIPPPNFFYQLYLKPGDNYTCVTRSVTIDENAGAASTGVSQNDGGQPFGNAPPDGVNIDKPYDFRQIAAIAGTATAPPGFSVYNLQVNVGAPGTGAPGLGVATQYSTNNQSGVPLPSPIDYVARIFKPADLTAAANAAVAACKVTGAAPAGYVPVGAGPSVGPKQ